MRANAYDEMNRSTGKFSALILNHIHILEGYNNVIHDVTGFNLKINELRTWTLHSLFELLSFSRK